LPPDIQQELPTRRQSGDVAWRFLPDGTGSQMRYIYVPLRAPDGETQAAIVAGESLAPRDAFLRHAHVRKAAMGVTVLMLSGLLALVLGTWLIDRPLDLIRQSIRAIGEGRLVPPILLERHDEIGALASDVNTAKKQGAARLIGGGEAAGPEAQANPAVILDQSARMTAIVRQLLDYARRQGSQIGLVDLRHVVTGALGMLEPLVQKHDVEVAVSL